MDALLDSIRIAMGDGASADERRRAAVTCRALADAFDGMIVSGAEPPSAPPIAALTGSPLAGNPFAGLTADQILDLAIAKLRGVVGDDAPSLPTAPFRLTFVPVPRLR